MIRHTVIAIAAAAALAGCQRSVEVVSGGEVAPITPVVPPTSSVLSAGAILEVQLNEQLSTEANEVGDTFTASVVSNLMASNGEVVVPAGAVVRGRVSALDDSDNPTDRALIQLQFDRLSFNGRDYDFRANITSVATVQRRERDVARDAATGAVAGAVLGAIISGIDLENIIKAGAVGAAAGTVISLGVGDVEHVLPAGTRMTVQATQSVNLR
ncbi:MAG: hypothetical protein ACREOK_02795 [Gemmatimonadaceae bacterium]